MCTRAAVMDCRDRASALVYQQKTAQRGTKQPLHLLLYVVWTHHEHIIPLKHPCMLGSQESHFTHAFFVCKACSTRCECLMTAMSVAIWLLTPWQGSWAGFLIKPLIDWLTRARQKLTLIIIRNEQRTSAKMHAQLDDAFELRTDNIVREEKGDAFAKKSERPPSSTGCLNRPL